MFSRFCWINSENFSIPFEKLKLSPRGDWLAIGGDHGGLTVWEWQSQNYVMEQKTQGHAVQCAAYSPCGTKMITGATDGACKVWSAMSGFCIVTFKNHTAPVTGVSWLRSGKVLQFVKKVFFL